MNWQPDRELRNLVDGMLDNRLSRSEAARLEELMESDARAMDYFLNLAGQEALLPRLWEQAEPAEMVAIRRRHRWPWLAAAAAVALGGFLLWPRVSLRAPSVVASEAPFARLTSGSGLTGGDRALVPGSALGPEHGDLTMSSGLAEVTHHSGTRLLIEGPAVYQATGPNSGRLKYGKVVAEVPPGAEGFVVEWADGKVVDFGTEFAIDVPRCDRPAEVGVFRGEVRVSPVDCAQHDGSPLYTGHAVRVSGTGTSGMRSIPFDQDRFIRQMPSRELPWFYRGGSEAFVWDVSHLVWSPGERLAVFKWMSGSEALTLRKVELLLDGKVVATDEHPCSVGHLSSTVGNVYRLPVPAGRWRRGAWSLRAWPGDGNSGTQVEGILMFEDGAALAASPEDFTGPWDYVHDGRSYRRAFHPDGTCTLWVDDRASDYFQDATWDVNGGILRVSFPASKLTEQHLLRDRESLLFINQPYRNARRGE